MNYHIHSRQLLAVKVELEKYMELLSADSSPTHMNYTTAHELYKKTETVRRQSKVAAIAKMLIAFLCPMWAQIH